MTFPIAMQVKYATNSAGQRTVMVVCKAPDGRIFHGDNLPVNLGPIETLIAAGIEKARGRYEGLVELADAEEKPVKKSH